jgi:hypothetical protein
MPRSRHHAAAAQSGEAQEVTAETATTRRADRGGPDAVQIELGLKHFAGELGHRDRRAVVGHDHRHARRRAHAMAERRIFFHLAECRDGQARPIDAGQLV